MEKLELIAEEVHQEFDEHTSVRDEALKNARALNRHCAHAIRAVHRDDHNKVDEDLKAATELLELLREMRDKFPSVYFAGYTQDALKEYAEANIVAALVRGEQLPSPSELKLEKYTYMKGLAEVVGELRRRILDILRHGHSAEVEKHLKDMDDIYGVLVTMDYPDAVTGGLRRLTDIARSIIERTRGDVTLSFRQERLEQVLGEVEDRISKNSNS